MSDSTWRNFYDRASVTGELLAYTERCLCFTSLEDVGNPDSFFSSTKWLSTIYYTLSTRLREEVDLAYKGKHRYALPGMRLYLNIRISEEEQRHLLHKLLAFLKHDSVGMVSKYGLFVMGGCFKAVARAFISAYVASLESKKSLSTIRRDEKLFCLERLLKRNKLAYKVDKNVVFLKKSGYIIGLKASKDKFSLAFNGAPEGLMDLSTLIHRLGLNTAPTLPRRGSTRFSGEATRFSGEATRFSGEATRSSSSGDEKRKSSSDSETDTFAGMLLLEMQLQGFANYRVEEAEPLVKAETADTGPDLAEAPPVNTKHATVNPEHTSIKVNKHRSVESRKAKTSPRSKRLSAKRKTDSAQ